MPEFAPEVLRVFDRYVHGLIDRRGFLDEAAPHAGGGARAEALLEALNPRFAEARQVAPNDPRLHGETVDIPAPRGHARLRGYLVQPLPDNGARGGLLPAVLVAHENRGLNPHIADVARRFALAGFVALAPDALTPVGGYPGDEDEARARFATLDPERTRQGFAAAARFLRAHPSSNGRLGVVGFCWGGGIANILAARLPWLAAAVPFYGNAPAGEPVARIRARLLIHHAEHDERINAGWPAYEAALQAAGVRYERHLYPGTQHGFHNDTTPRHDADAARLAWERTLGFLRQALRA